MCGDVCAGTVAYTAQDPWICNATLRDNILMGRDFDEPRYQQVRADEPPMTSELQYVWAIYVYFLFTALTLCLSPLAASSECLCTHESVHACLQGM